MKWQAVDVGASRSRAAPWREGWAFVQEVQHGTDEADVYTSDEPELELATADAWTIRGSVTAGNLPGTWDAWHEGEHLGSYFGRGEAIETVLRTACDRARLPWSGPSEEELKMSTETEAGGSSRRE